MTIEGRDEHGRITRTTGRKPGSRNKRTLAAELLPQDALPRLYQALLTAALAEDVAAANTLLARLDPVRKGALVELPAMPAIVDMLTAREASAKILVMVAAGELSAEEAKAVQELIACHVELHDAAAMRADLDRVFEHLGLPRDTRPGELANGHG